MTLSRRRESRSVEGLTKGKKKETRMCLQKSRPAPSFEGRGRREKGRRERGRRINHSGPSGEDRTVRTDHRYDLGDLGIIFALFF